MVRNITLNVKYELQFNTQILVGKLNLHMFHYNDKIIINDVFKCNYYFFANDRICKGWNGWAISG